MTQCTFVVCQWRGFGGRQRRPLQGNSASDRMRRGPGCNRHSRVCADTSVPFTGLPRRFHSDGHRDAFLRHHGIYLVRWDFNFKSKVKTKTLGRDQLPPVGRPRALGKETCREDHASSHRPQMSSGRLFLDRIARQQSPSPLHRRDQNKMIARSKGTIYHQTVSSVLTGCLTFRDKRSFRSLQFAAGSTLPTTSGSAAA
jgi:hypothetical protein